MRTTLELDDELVVTAKQMAREQGSTVGQVISALAMVSLSMHLSERVRNGVPLFSGGHGFSNTGGERPGLQLVNELRDEG